MTQVSNKTFHLPHVCTTISSMLRQLIGRIRNWRAERSKRRAIEDARIDPNEKCPACGWRRGKVRFSLEARCVIHTCAICRAQWGEQTLVKADAWSRKAA